MNTKKVAAISITALALLGAACGSDPDTATNDSSPATTAGATGAETSAAPAADSTTPATGDSSAATGDDFPEITDVSATKASDGTWTIEVTVSSPYDSPDQYADAWRVLDQDGNELGIRELAHDHASEQPFTRDLTGLVIPEDVKKISVEGRDSVNGWSGETYLLSLPQGSSY